MTDRMTAAEAAKYLGLSRQSLYNLRGAGEGPASYKIGGRVWYDRVDLETWIARQRAATLVGG